MRTLIIYLIFLFLLFAAIVTNAQMSKSSLYDSLNFIRKQNGLPELTRSISLEIASQKWLSRIQKHEQGLVHDHDTDDGEVLTNCYDPIAWWMGSPSHRRVLLSKKFTKIGIAYRRGEYCARLK